MLQRLQLIHVALLALLIVAVGALSSRLPADLPLHYDIHGGVDRWASNPLHAWLLPTLVCLGVNGMLMLLSEAVARQPLLINLPDPDRTHLRALPIERRKVVGRSARIVFVAAGIGVTLLTALIQALELRGALDPASTNMMPLAVLALPILLTIPIGLAVLRVQSTLAEQHKAFAADQAGPT